MNDRAAALLAARRGRLADLLGHPLPPAAGGSGVPLTESEARFLQEEGESLYWNELEWENLTDEEQLDDGPLIPLTFPGFLAYVRGLLLDEVMPDALAPAAPRPEAVEGLLGFLAVRVGELEDAQGGEGPESERARQELELTRGLLDLVLGLLHGLPPEVLDGPRGGTSG
jgi:hypothetical protein